MDFFQPGRPLVLVCVHHKISTWVAEKIRAFGSHTKNAGKEVNAQNLTNIILLYLLTNLALAIYTCLLLEMKLYMDILLPLVLLATTCITVDGVVRACPCSFAR